MKYKDAKLLRNKLGKSIEYSGTIFKIVIVPQNEEDFHKFIQIYRGISHLDDPGLNYSRDGEFVLCGLWTDGINVISKRDLSDFY